MKQIELTQDLKTQIDDADYGAVSKHKWCVQRSAKNEVYAVTTVTKGGKPSKLYLHRLISGSPKGIRVFHSDGNTLNNTRSNLRLAHSRSVPQDGNKFTGVQYVPKGKKHWKAFITVAGKQIHVGTFETAEGAATARDEAALTAWGEFASLNFPRVRTPENYPEEVTVP